MATREQMQRLVKIVEVLQSKDTNYGVPLAEITEALPEIKYSTLRSVIFKDFPECFKQPEPRWVGLSGTLPLWWSERNKITAPVEVVEKTPAVEVSESSVGKSEKKRREWVWDEEAVRLLDDTFTRAYRKTLDEVIKEARKDKRLGFMQVVGKTLAHAAEVELAKKEEENVES